MTRPSITHRETTWSRSFLLVATAAALVMAACSSGDDTATTTTEEGSSSTTTAVEALPSEARPPPTTGPAPAVVRGEDWPTLSRSFSRSGISSDADFSASQSGFIDILWQVNTGHRSFSSPSVVEIDGRQVVFVGNQGGVLTAYDALGGERIWHFEAGGPIQSSPTVVDDVVYFGASDGVMYALDAATGEAVCTFEAGGVISSTPAVVDVAGIGRVVFVGDNGISGADDGGHVWAIHGVDGNASTDCSEVWDFADYGDPAGSVELAGTWSPVSVSTDKNGRQLVLFGGSSPDNAVYAADAIDGSVVWRFATEVNGFDTDVGAGVTISAPGVNGFANGVAYVAGKNKIMHAFDLETGELLWEFRIVDDTKAGGATRSTATLVDERLYVGYGAGVYALDAVTGAKLWNSEGEGIGMEEVISSPSVTGPVGDRVMFVGDLSGAIYVLDESGTILWKHVTGEFVYPSAAVSGGRAFISSADGYLYAIGVAGVGTGRPESSIVEPALEAEAENPAGDLTIAGIASDDGGVASVKVAVKSDTTGEWWDAATQTWTPVFSEVDAALESAGSAATGWSTSFPVPPPGGEFSAQSVAIDVDGTTQQLAAQTSFAVTPLGDPPETTIESPEFREVFHFLESGRVAVSIPVVGGATDPAGANPGVAEVKIFVRDLETDEYYCGFDGCGEGTGAGGWWTAERTVLNATLASPGATDTAWTFDFMTKDVPGKYRITAWAIDHDNESDFTKAIIQRVCLRDAGINTCA